MLNLIECRAANPMKVTDWSDVDEGGSVTCACCGWIGRLGQCVKAAESSARVYACAECGMALLARVLPRVVAYSALKSRQEWRRAHLIAANF